MGTFEQATRDAIALVTALDASQNRGDPAYEQVRRQVLADYEQPDDLIDGLVALILPFADRLAREADLSVSEFLSAIAIDIEGDRD